MGVKAIIKYTKELKADIAKYEAYKKEHLSSDLYDDNLIETKERLQEVRIMYREFFGKSYFQIMDEIVNRVIERYLGDFYYHDLRLIRDSESKKFAWCVRDYGSHMVSLEGTEEDIKNTKEWVDAIEKNYGNRSELYMIDTYAGVVRKLNSFQDIKYSIKRV